MSVSRFFASSLVSARKLSKTYCMDSKLRHACVPVCGFGRSSTLNTQIFCAVIRLEHVRRLYASPLLLLRELGNSAGTWRRLPRES